MPEKFTTIKPEQITENLFEEIGKNWMLITAKDPNGKANTMTASWGSCGILWNKPVAICFIRPQRYTYHIVDSATHFTLSFFTQEYKEALTLCGKKSGRDTDKFTESNLTPMEIDGFNTVGIEQAKLILVCKKLYADNLLGKNFISEDISNTVYSANDFHRFFIGEITSVLKSV